MYQTNQKIIVFLIAFILAVSALSGAVSATICTDNTGSYVQGVINNTSIDYTFISRNNSTHVHSESFKKNTSPTYYLASKPTDQQLKKQIQGIENLRTISTKGIPPKRPDEIVSDCIDRFQSMINTTKTRITHTFSSFYKKMIK